MNKDSRKRLNEALELIAQAEALLSQAQDIVAAALLMIAFEDGRKSVID